MGQKSTKRSDGKPGKSKRATSSKPGKSKRATSTKRSTRERTTTTAARRAVREAVAREMAPYYSAVADAAKEIAARQERAAARSDAFRSKHPVPWLVSWIFSLAASLPPDSPVRERAFRRAPALGRA